MDDAQALVDLSREGEPVQDDLRGALTELRAGRARLELMRAGKKSSRPSPDNDHGRLIGFGLNGGQD